MNNKLLLLFMSILATHIHTMEEKGPRKASREGASAKVSAAPASKNRGLRRSNPTAPTEEAKKSSGPSYSYAAPRVPYLKTEC